MSNLIETLAPFGAAVFALLVGGLVGARVAYRRLPEPTRHVVGRVIEDVADVSVETETKTPVAAGR